MNTTSSSLYKLYYINYFRNEVHESRQGEVKGTSLVTNLVTAKDQLIQSVLRVHVISFMIFHQSIFDSHKETSQIDKETYVLVEL